MSSIIFIEPNRRKRLVRAWKEQIFEMANKLEILKKEAENLKEFDLKEDIEYELKKFKEEFDVVFNGASNEEIVRKFDIKYWDADKVDTRLRTISENINQLDLAVREKIFEKNMVEQKVNELKEQAYKYEFLKEFRSDLKDLENLSLEEIKRKINSIENEINTKISVYNRVQKTKHSLEETLKVVKKKLNKYSFLREFHNDLNNIENKLKKIKDLEIDKLNEVVEELNNLKDNIESKEFKILNSIESIKEYEILQTEIKEINNTINNLNLRSKTSEIEKEKLQKEYKEFLEKLKYYSIKEFERIKKLDIPIETKLFELKLTYANEKKKYLISSKLEEIKEKYKEDNQFLEKFSERIENIIENSEERAFYNLLYDIEKYEFDKKSQQIQITLLKEKLQKLGYSFTEELKLGQVGYIDTGEKEYKIKYVFHEDGEIGFNFVRIGNAEKLNSYEKEKTIEKATKWCKHFDLLKEELKKEGINLNVTLREEPTIDDIIFEELEIESVAEKEEAITQEKYLEE